MERGLIAKLTYMSKKAKLYKREEEVAAFRDKRPLVLLYYMDFFAYIIWYRNHQHNQASRLLSSQPYQNGENNEVLTPEINSDVGKKNPRNCYVLLSPAFVWCGAWISMDQHGSHLLITARSIFEVG